MIQMLDLKSEWNDLKDELTTEIIDTIESGQYINGPKVKAFQKDLELFLGVKHVIPCGNGTDALMIALMALELKKGDEIIVPAFTYIATVEVIEILGLTPVYVDVDLETFNLSVQNISKAKTKNTKAIIPVHLYGRMVDIEPIIEFARENNIFVIEDTAQALGSFRNFNLDKRYAGTYGDIGTTSFFPTKNLGCYGDGGAIVTNSNDLANKIMMIANHGQSSKYIHDIVGVNSRLDSVQAAILSVKLKKLEDFIVRRREIAMVYTKSLEKIRGLIVPKESSSIHAYHQYTIRLANKKTRNDLQKFLNGKGIQTMVYYPIPIYRQKAYSKEIYLPNTEILCDTVLSLPINPFLRHCDQEKIIDAIADYFK